MEPTTPDPRLIEPPSAEGLMPITLGWPVWTAIGLGLLLLVLIAVLVWQKGRKAAETTAENLRKQAHVAAVAELATCPTENLTATATECSIILRRYLAALTQDPALFETHEEWVARHNALDSMADEIRDQVRQLFCQLAQWKYAPAEQHDEPDHVIEQSRDLIETLNRECPA